jgi:cell division protein FtsB
LPVVIGVWISRAGNVDGVENLPVDSAWMSEDPAAESQPSAPSRRLRLPATPGRLATVVVLLVVAAFLAVQTGSQVYANWTITQEAERVRAEIAAIEARNELLRRELDYLRSDAYVSQQARRFTNLGRPDEQVLIIPPGAEVDVPPELLPEPEPVKPLLEQWLDLFFGG